jgi:tetratricopeptide (TPR) repeat protein
MSEFNYGDPHPQGIDRGKLKYESDRRKAIHFASVLSTAGKLFIQGNEGMVAGPQLFDREQANIRHSQKWAAQYRGEDRVATELLCRSYPLAGSSITGLRLSAREDIQWLEAALGACRMLGDRAREGGALSNLAAAHSRLGDVRVGIQLSEQALEIMQAIGDQRNASGILSNLGSLHSSLGDVRTAIRYYQQALGLLRSIDDPRTEATALGNLGIAYEYLGDARTATRYYQQALEIARKLGDRRTEGRMLSELGTACRKWGDSQRAIVFHEQHLAIARSLGDREDEGKCLTSLGLAYAILGNPRKAIGYYEEALAICRDREDRYSEGKLLGNFGIAYTELGDYQAAIGFHAKASTISRELGDRRGEAEDLGNLGTAHGKLGQYSAAIRYFEEDLAICRELEYRQGEAIAWWNIALANQKLGQRSAAIQYAENALKLFEAINDPSALTVRRSLTAWCGDADRDSALMPWWVRLKVPGFMTRTRVLGRVVTRLVWASVLTVVSLWLWLASHHLLGIVVFLGPCIVLSVLEGIWVLAAFRYIERRNRWEELWTSEYIESRQVFLPVCIMTLVDIILAFSIGFILWLYLFLRT